MKENQQLENIRQEYLNMNIPEDGLNRMKESIDRARMEKRAFKKRARNRNIAAAAAAVILMVALPNMNADVAYAMEKIPLLGSFFRAVTFRDYTYEDDSNYAKIKVPNVFLENDRDVNQQNPSYQEAADEINLDINSITEELIKRFEEEVAKQNEGHLGIEVNSQVITDDDRWFTLRLNIFEVMASGYQYSKIYTIDKQTGKVITLKDLFADGMDYKKILSEEIKRMMGEQMAKEDGAVYFLDGDLGPEFDFHEISDNVNFYFSRNGELIIVFDEYEVAPGYMGSPEFTIPKSITDSIMKQ